jgi:hypothetical protein
MTSSLVKNATSDKTVFKNERINQALSSEDGEKLVFIGAEYHYIFDYSEIEFSEFLKSREWIWENLKGGDFEVDKNGKLSGQLYFMIGSEQKKLWGDSPFSKLWQYQNVRNLCPKWVMEPGVFCTKFQANDGVRYKAGNFKLPESIASNNLPNSNFTIQETVSPSLTEKSALLLTPVTVLADGALILGNIILFSPVLITCPFNTKCNISH